MPRAPRPNNIKLLKPWAAASWPNDPVRQQREVLAGTKALQEAEAAAAKNAAEMRRRQRNLLKK